MGFLSFFHWMCRTLHLFSAVAWIGGLGFIGGVYGPVLDHFRARAFDIDLAVRRRFVGFMWTTAWGLGVSGVLLMMLDGRFLWGDWSTAWRQMLLAKQVLFALLVFVVFAISASLKEIMDGSPAGTPDDPATPLGRARRRIALLTRYAIFFGILAILIAAAMPAQP